MVMAVAKSVDAAIINPLDERMMASIMLPKLWLAEMNSA